MTRWIGLDTGSSRTAPLPTVAALYVARGGCYFGLPDVDPWDEARDARLYRGSSPVVAHPPSMAWNAHGLLPPNAFGWTRDMLGSPAFRDLLLDIAKGAL